MVRTLRIVIVTVPLVLASVLFWHTVYRSAPLPQADRVALDHPATLTWHAGDGVSIQAQTVSDAWTALGYAHGLKRAWPMTLWRTTGTGRLAEWFGPRLLALDRHARRLGFAHHARETYEQLPTRQQALLQAYVRGLNAALQTKHVRTEDPFVLLNRTPPRWEAWHPLVVERLFAWLATDRLSLPDSMAAPAVRAFTREDARFRRWLHVHGLSRSVVGSHTTAADSSRTRLVVQYATGASALPVFQEVQVHVASHPRYTLVTVPGSPVVLAGTGDGHAWAWLPRSTTRLAQRPDTTWTRWYERLETHKGQETLVTLHRHDGWLPLTPNADTTWALHWPGLRPATDLAAWQPMAPPGDTTRLRLFTGEGLSIAPNGTRRVHGSPPFQLRLPNAGRLLGGSAWATDQANALRHDSLSLRASPAAWMQRDSSTWAAQQMKIWGPALAPLAHPDTDPAVRDAYTYLQNWNHRFNASSIGASLFERWMQAIHRRAGPQPLNPRHTDTRTADSVRGRPQPTSRVARAAFVDAVRHLRRTYGADLRQWRWERVLPGDCMFPVWSADSLVVQDVSGMATTHFAPVPCRRNGHPSTPTGGPSLVSPAWPTASPLRWRGWTNPQRRDMSFRRMRFAPGRFLARARSNPARPAVQRITDDSAQAVTRLRPVMP
mgnify:CR=1 FL=1